MLAALLLNLGVAATADFTAGAVIHARPHAPEVGTQYYPGQDQWSSPEGRAPSRSLPIIIPRAAEAIIYRKLRAEKPLGTIVVETQWHVSHACSPAKLSASPHTPIASIGQTLDLGSTKLQISSHAATVEDSWSVVAPVVAKRRLPTTREIRVGAGATAMFKYADQNTLTCSPPDVHGIINPTDEELLVMVYAARRARQNRQIV